MVFAGGKGFDFLLRFEDSRVGELDLRLRDEWLDDGSV